MSYVAKCKPCDAEGDHVGRVIAVRSESRTVAAEIAAIFRRLEFKEVETGEVPDEAENG